MENVQSYCECAFCTSIETPERKLMPERQQNDKHPCMKCGREWLNPEHCYCSILEEELILQSLDL